MAPPWRSPLFGSSSTRRTLSPPRLCTAARRTRSFVSSPAVDSSISRPAAISTTSSSTPSGRADRVLGGLPGEGQQGHGGQECGDRADRPDGEVADQRGVPLLGVGDRAGGGQGDREDRGGDRAADRLGRVGHAGGEGGALRWRRGRGGGRQRGDQCPRAEAGDGHVDQRLTGGVVEGQAEGVPQRDEQGGQYERAAARRPAPRPRGGSAATAARCRRYGGG